MNGGKSDSRLDRLKQLGDAAAAVWAILTLLGLLLFAIGAAAGWLLRSVSSRDDLAVQVELRAASSRPDPRFVEVFDSPDRDLPRTEPSSREPLELVCVVRITSGDPMVYMQWNDDGTGVWADPVDVTFADGRAVNLHLDRVPRCPQPGEVAGCDCGLLPTPGTPSSIPDPYPTHGP